jgi:ribosomal protein S18 acetylase RimI-like enzyme
VRGGCRIPLSSVLPVAAGIERVAACCCRNGTAHATPIPSTDDQLSPQFPGAQFDIIKLDGGPIGRIIVDRNNARLLIVDQAIVPELRNRGIGTAIMHSVMDQARAAALPVGLHVASDNDTSLRLYLRLGFVLVPGSIPMYTELEWNATTGPADHRHTLRLR